MSAPILSPDSDEMGGSIRDSVDEHTAQRQRAVSPRSELFAQTSLQQNKIPATEGHRVSRRRHKRHRSDRELAYAESSPEELLALLVDQEHESRRLRRALLTAADRIDVESRRAADVELVNSDVADRFKIVNDGRLAAQREALKASQELRLHQFQLENAQTEITRAHEALRVVQTQRDEAEMAAARAREKARRLQQERIVAAAREEGRKYGFEAGFKRAHEEYSFMRQPDRRRNHYLGQSRTERNEQPPPPVEDAHVVQQRNEVLHDDDGLLSPISSPSRLLLRGLAQTNSPEVIRIDHPPPPSDPPGQRRSSQEVHPPPLPVTAPTPVTQQTPANPLRHSSSIPLQIYTLDIPPADQIEQQYGRNEPTRKSTQRWVTANEHLETSHQQQQQMMQEQFEEIFQHPDVDHSRNMSQPAAGPKRKDTWYNRLRRRTFGRKSKQEALNSATTGSSMGDPHTSQSWYKRKPQIHVRDFAVPVARPRSSVDSGSVSTGVSQLGILSTPNGSVSGRSGRLGGGLARKFKQNLQAISEDPMSRETTPLKENWQSRSVDTPDAGGSSSYSDPKAVDEWRKSSASTPKMSSVASPRRPPSYVRRPAQLTVPARLAPDDEMPGPARERTIWDNTGTSSPSRRPPSNRSSLRVVNADEPEISPGIGITVQPPSRSPTDAVKTPSSHGNGYLSPNHAHQSLPPQVVHSAPSFPSVGLPLDGASPTRDPANHTQSRPPSRGYAPSVRSVSSTTQDASRPNSPHGSTHNQLPPSSNGWFPKSPRRVSQFLPPDRPPSRAQSRTGAVTPHTSSVDLRSTPGSVRNHPLPPMNGSGNLGLSHVTSNTSLHSTGSLYTKFRSETYLDPAFFPPEDSAVTDGNISDTARARSVSSPVPRSRAYSKAASTSTSPGLEYINPS